MPASRILLGVIGRPHGVRGDVRVTSYADPPEAIASYGALSDERGRRFVLRWLRDDLVEIAELLDGQERRVTDRTAAERLTNTRLFVDRDRLPAPEPDEFYLADLVGLVAFDTKDVCIGAVLAVHDYGAGASLEIVRDGAAPLVVPFTRAAVPIVDLPAGKVVVDPPAEVDATPLPGALPRADLSRQAGEVRSQDALSCTSPATRERSARASAPGEGQGKGP